MSPRLINLSSDLKRLRDEGYDIEIRGSTFLLVKNVPYLNSQREVKRGMLVTNLILSGNITAAPDTHTIFFAGEYPCHHDGSEISEFRNSSTHRDLGEGIMVDHQFSSKPYPSGRYDNYYDKITTYVSHLSTPARHIEPNADAKIFPVIQPGESASVFKYFDTATSRAGIGAVVSKLESAKIAIVGLGGTGSYVLDHVAKTPVTEIHLFDGDNFIQHNAFRAPGAASLSDLAYKPYKVDYYKRIYSEMRNGIYPHRYNIDGQNAEKLRGMDFVFICIDGGNEKQNLLLRLEEYGVCFIDTGMGINLIDGALTGIARVTTSVPSLRQHVWLEGRISFAGDVGNDEYRQNIQISELNALNAVMAVIKWKKLFGFYHDLEMEHHCTYTISGNKMTNCDIQ